MSYLAPNGHYSVATNGFTNQVNAPPLYGLASAQPPTGTGSSSTAARRPSRPARSTRATTTSTRSSRRPELTRDRDRSRHAACVVESTLSGRSSPWPGWPRPVPRSTWSCWRSPRSDAGRPRRPTTRSRIAVLVPAHDEAPLVGRCVASLPPQSYPADLYDIVVIADNCTDDTAARAAAAGATVLVRPPDARGKGPALRWAMDRLLECDPDLAALAVVDADSIADPGLLGALVARLERGAPVVQAEYLGRPRGRVDQVRAALCRLLLFHRVRFGGEPSSGCRAIWWATACCSAARCSRRIRGTPSRAPRTSSTRSTCAWPGCGPSTPGRPSSAPRRGAWAGGRDSAARWEGGRFHVVRTRLRLLLRGGDPPAALVPARRRRRPGCAPARPAGDAARSSGRRSASSSSRTGVAPGGRSRPGWWRLGGPTLVRSASPPAAPPLMWRALSAAPALVVAVWTRLGYWAGWAATWERTTRPERSWPKQHRPVCGGQRARGGPMTAALAPRAELATARGPRSRRATRDRRACRSIPSTSIRPWTTPWGPSPPAPSPSSARSTSTSWSTPDETPRRVRCSTAASSTWPTAPRSSGSSRLLGTRLPGRVAGSDLVPRLAASAADRGAGIFFLGRERQRGPHGRTPRRGVPRPRGRRGPRTGPGVARRMDDDDIIRRTRRAVPTSSWSLSDIPSRTSRSPATGTGSPSQSPSASAAPST